MYRLLDRPDHASLRALGGQEALHELGATGWEIGIEMGNLTLNGGKPCYADARSGSSESRARSGIDRDSDSLGQ